MSLLISKNGKISDYPRPKKNLRVTSADQNKVEFEELLHKEKSHSENYHPEENGDEKHRENNAVIRQYQKQTPRQNHKKITLAKDICSSPLITALPEINVEDALVKMKKYKIHHLPLVGKNGVLEGIVSDRDLLGRRHRENAMNFASKEVVVTKASTDIKIVARMMLEEGISALPLISEEEELIGMITKTDLLECIVKSMPFQTYV